MKRMAKRGGAVGAEGGGGKGEGAKVWAVPALVNRRRTTGEMSEQYLPLW